MTQAPPPVFVSLWSVRNTTREHGLTMDALPAFVTGSGFDGLEISDRELPAAAGFDDGQFAERCRAANCGVIVDINCDLTESDTDARATEISHAEQMLHRAAVLGARVVRISLGGQAVSVSKLMRYRRGHGPEAGWPGRESVATRPAVRRLSHWLRQQLPATVSDLDEKIGRAVAALRQLVAVAAPQGIAIGIENHWGITTRPEWILRVIDEVESEWLGTCADFGNFPRRVDPYAGLALLATRAVHVQAKSWRFGPGGEETGIDYRRALEPFRAAGYKGAVAIEYEGAGPDLDHCLRTRDLIRRCWQD